MKRKIIKVIKKTLVFPIYLIQFFMVEIWMGAGIGDAWDKMWKWTDK